MIAMCRVQRKIKSRRASQYNFFHKMAAEFCPFSGIDETVGEGREAHNVRVKFHEIYFVQTLATSLRQNNNLHGHASVKIFNFQ